MNNYFLLFLFLWIGTIHAQSPSAFVQQKISSIDIPADALRHTIETEDLTTTLNFCDLNPGDEYVISITAMDNPSCYSQLFLKQHGLVENQSNRMVFTALSPCEYIDVSNTCGAILSTHYYVSIINNSTKKEPMLKSMGIMTTAGEAESLVRDVFIKGECVVIENITYQGNNNAIGQFSGGDFAIGIEEGIIITSGAVLLAHGPNNQTNASADWGDNTGDGDLEGTAGSDIMDAAVLEFDFTPTGDMVSFDFVFASEEYCDYVNAGFNDAFGFYLTGPGHDATNIARANGDGPQVSINSINHLQNTQYFVDNVPPGQQQFGNCFNHTPTPGPNNFLIQYDGYTIKLSAIADVEPCVPYHIKLAVGDAVDGLFDSAVFLGANSFDAASLVTIEGEIDSGDPFATEGCDNASLIFTRENFPIEQAVELTYTIADASTATSGVDYEALSGSVTLNAGSNMVTVPIIVIPDELDEGVETIVIELRTSLCGDLCEDVQTVIIEIQDGTPLAVDFSPVPTCGESSTTLSPNIGDGSGDYTFEWSDGSTGSTLDVDLTETLTTYSVTVVDNEGCAAGTAEIEVSGGEAPEASIDGNAAICEEPASEIFLVNFTGNGPWTLEYSINGNPQAPITDITDNPYELFASEVGTYTLDGVSANNCPGTTNGSAVIELSELLVITDSNDVTCGGEADGTASLDIDGGTPPYTIDWSNGEGDAAITDLEAGIYDVTIVDVNDCTFITMVEILEPIPLDATASIDSEPDCDNPMGGGASLTVSGGTEPYTFAWDNGTTDQNLQDVGGGVYEVLITDDSGCTITASVDIPAGGEQPEAVASSPNDIDCDMTEVTLSGVGSSDGTYLWTTDDGNILSGETTLTPDVNQAGTYTLTVTTPDGCMATAEVTIAGDAAMPVADAGFPEDLTCTNNGVVTLDGGASSSGNEFTYLWTTQDGNIINGENTQSPDVDEAGTYTLTVTNIDNNCEITASVTIEEDMVAPTIIIEEPENFDCNTTVTSIILDASASSNGNNFEYEWATDDDGTIDQGGNTSTPSVSSGGTYTLTITNTENGCTETMDVTVQQNISNPMAVIVDPTALTCTSTETTLDGSGSSGADDLDFLWATDDGSITGALDEAITSASGPGTYILTITDPATGCTDMTEVTVETDENLPTAVVIDPGMLTCNEASLVLDASSSSTMSGNLDFEWSNNVEDLDNLMTTITSPGMYSITITDLDNGCEAIASITIDENTDTPDVTATEEATLICGATSVEIEAFTTVNNPIYQWFLDGNILDNETSATLDVTQSGNYTVEVTGDNGCVGTAASVVSQDDNLPSVSIEPADNLTCITTALILDASNSDNGDEFTYVWVASNGGNILSGETTLMPEVDAIGTYTLTITNNDNNCMSTDFIEISSNTNPPIAMAVSVDELNCTVTQISLSGEGSDVGDNISYLWTTTNGVIDNGETTLTPTVSAVGDYILTVTNEDTGCSETATATVAENEDLPTAVIEPTNDLDCNTMSLELNANNSDNGDNYSFIWEATDGGVISEGATTLNPTITESGTYFLTITDNTSNCEASTSITIAEDNAAPEITPGTDYLLTCSDESLTISASTNVANPAYQWIAEDGTPIAGEMSADLVVTTDGVYTIMVTDTDNGCSSTADIPVDEDANTPNVVINAPTPLTCEETEQTLNASASDNGDDFEYLWVASNGGNILSGENTLMPEIGATGTYTLTITNTLNDCSSSDFINITETVEPPVAAATSTDELDCTTTEIPLSGEGSDAGDNISYLWTTVGGVIISGETTLTPTVGGVGDYTLTVTNDDTGCSSTASTTVAENEDLPTAFIAETDDLTCGTTSLELDATSSDNGTNYSFVWDATEGGVISEGENTLTPTITEPGVYLLTITDNTSNCEAVTSITIAEDTTPPDIFPGSDYLLTCSDESLTISAGTNVDNPTYQWMTEDGIPIADATAADLEVTSSGTYTVMVTNTDNGCSNSEDVTVNQDDNLPNVSIAMPLQITCDDESVFLDATASDNGDDFMYQWVASDGGVILEGDSTLTPEVGSIGTYTLEITNIANGCSSTSFTSVSDNIAAPTVEAGQGLQFACGDTQATLDGTGSDEGANFTYLWSTDNGVIENGDTTLTPTISAPGIYTLTVENTENGCTSTDQVEITQDTDAPTAIAGTAASLTCSTTSVILDGSASSMGTDFTYLWTTMDGTIVNGETTLNPEVSEAGTYVLTVTNNANNCTNSSSVTVEIDDTTPNVVIEEAESLTCGASSVTLDGSASDNGNNFTPVWTTLGGNIVSGANTYMPVVDMAGTYILEITNSTNGCTNSSSIEVSVDGDTPNVTIATANDLTCNITSLMLNANGSDFGDGFTINWSTDTGNFVEGEETLTPTIDAPGNYTLSITNTNNGCTDATNILIEENTITASVNAGQTQTLDCTVTSISLNGSSDLDNGTILWTTNGGNILNGATTLTPTVNGAGIYTLTITNSENGCSASADVTIELDPSVPEVLIDMPTMLTCETTTITLDASQTTSDQNLVFQWTTTNGNIISGADTPTPMVDQAGNYVLTILIGDNCTNTSAIQVLEDATEPIADAGIDFTVNCTEPSTLNGTSSSVGSVFTYEWTTNNGEFVNSTQTLQPNINGGGLYTLTVLNTQNGCTATDAVNVIDDAPESVQSLVIDPDCFNDIGSFGVSSVSGGTAPYVYSIDGGATFQSSSNFPNLAPGAYDFVVQDANDCTYEESFNVAEDIDLNLSLETFVKIDLGESHQINAQVSIPTEDIESIQWSPADSTLSCVDCLNPQATPTETTTYSLTITDMNGCETTAYIDIIVNKEVPIYIPNAFSPAGEMNTVFTIHAEHGKVKNINSLQIFNRWGELVFFNENFRPNDFDMGWNGTFDGEALNPGVFVYWTEIELQDGRTILLKGDISIVK